MAARRSKLYAGYPTRKPKNERVYDVLGNRPRARGRSTMFQNIMIVGGLITAAVVGYKVATGQKL